MATKQIGKLKLHWSKRGVAYKWGDGDIHRLSFERKRTGGQEQSYDQAYGQSYATGDGQGYPQDYSQNYAAGYGPDDTASGGYYDQDDHEPRRYDVLYQNDWVMYALLILLPPLGIWILWKRERHTPLIRGILSAASAIWFVLLLVWIFSALFFGGKSDETKGGQVNPPPVTVQTAAPTATPALAGTQDFVTSPPAATPRPGTPSGSNANLGNDTASPSGGTTPSGTTYVYASNATGLYHLTDSCTAVSAGDTLQAIDLSLALQRKLGKCPVCYPDSAQNQKTYFIKTGNKYYHKAATCGNVKNLEPATQSEVERLGKTACPKCIGSVWATEKGNFYHKTANCSGMSGAKLVTVAAAQKAGKTKCPKCLGGTATKGTQYYSTKGGTYYHTNKTCGGMKGATLVTAAVVKARKQTACPVCVGAKTATGNSYYATKTGKFYHTKSDCSGMKNATKVSLTTAKKNGKAACPVCVKTAAKTANPASGSAVYYATSSGKYYHKTATCSGMKGAKKVTKAAAEKNGKKPCPDCLSNIATAVYATSGGTYYHKTQSCSGMKNAQKLSLATAKARGKTACPTCYKTAAAKAIYYYATKSGKHYHKTSTCSGMKNATRVTLQTALANGKTACPTCLKAATDKFFYATKSGKYYHVKSNCSGMTNASKITLAAAQRAGKSACPVCAKAVKPTPTPQSKKVYCFASTGSKYYHKDRVCSGLKNLKKVLLSAAKSRGKAACPVCVTKKVKSGNLTTSYADKQTVCYAASSSAYYHQDKNCVSGLKKTTVAAAKKNGRSACPSCAGNLNTYVYVTRSGTKYHRKSTCSGTVNAYKISLTSALKLNYVRCTKCNAPRK